MTCTDAGCGPAERSFAKMGDRGIRIWLGGLHHLLVRLKVRRTSMSNFQSLMCHPLHPQWTPLVGAKGILQQAHRQRGLSSSELHDPADSNGINETAIPSVSHPTQLVTEDFTRSAPPLDPPIHPGPTSQTGSARSLPPQLTNGAP